MTLRSSADGLLSVINDILDVSKLEAGKLHLEALDSILAEVVADATRTWGQAHQKGWSMVTPVEPGGPDAGRR